MKSELVKPTHLARRAVVYIRQSTPHQVVSNQESLRLQYALRERARELGWREADIDVIDSDLGLSAASAAQRTGFKELVGRVGLKEVGLILSIDVTRLARNCSDWYPLLDICGLHGCLIADRDGVYDPGSANGRLLLGLKGTISELELHTIRSRLTAGLVAKAERGELALTLPIGLVRDPSGVVVKDPNLEVQERLALLFATFLKLRTVAKVMREFNDRGLELPRRDRHGDLMWCRATTSAVAAILKNPAYAGAFVYGRTRLRKPSDGKSAMKAAATGVNLGNYVSLGSLLVMIFTTYWFFRYVRLGERLKDPAEPPPRSSVVSTLWIGLWAGCLGIVFSILLLLAAAWRILFVLLTNPQSGMLIAPAGTNPAYSLSAIDAVSLTLLIIGLAIELMVLGLTLWLLYRTTLPTPANTEVTAEMSI
jgi:DNA invertase Pin-like site-specific DNA recombinase